MLWVPAAVERRGGPCWTEARCPPAAASRKLEAKQDATKAAARDRRDARARRAFDTPRTGPYRARVKIAGAIVLAGAIFGLLATPRRIADASCFVLMADSMRHDGDLRYDRADLERAQALRFDDLPSGLMLVKRPDGGWGYGKPALYPLVALPWYAAFGVRGFLGLNGALLAACVLLGAGIVAPALGWRRGLGAAALVLGFSVAPVYVHWIDPFLLLTALVAAGVLAHRRGWPATSGAALGAVAACRFPYAFVAAVPVLLALRARRPWDAARVVAGAVAAGGVLVAITWASTGQASPYTGERYWFSGAVPFETPADVPGRPFSRDGLVGDWQPPALADVAGGLAHFVAGRYAGILLYFPTFFACLLWVRRWDVEKTLWLAAVLGFALALELTVPHNRIGGTHALGNRFFVLLPLALCWLDDVPARTWRVGASLALALFAVPILQDPVSYTVAPGRTLVTWPHRHFPFEWPLATHVSYPVAFPAGLHALTQNQHHWEPASGAVWTIGGTRADFVLVRPRDVPARVRLWSPLPAARVVDGTVARTLRFAGRAHDVTLTRPMAVYRDEYWHTDVAVYALGIRTRRAHRPAAVGESADRRALGVYVQPLP
jgi:hypothetical protein